jgi:Cu2+-exporting ATPase
MELKVTGMTCEGCKSSVERVVKRVPGVVSATVRLEENKLVIEGSPSREEIIKAIERAGYGIA